MRQQGMLALMVGTTPLCVSIIGTPEENYRIVENLCSQIHDPNPPTPPYEDLTLFDIADNKLRTVYFFFCSRYVTLESVVTKTVDACVRIAERDKDVPGSNIDLAARKEEAKKLAEEIWLWLTGFKNQLN